MHFVINDILSNYDSFLNWCFTTKLTGSFCHILLWTDQLKTHYWLIGLTVPEWNNWMRWKSWSLRGPRFISLILFKGRHFWKWKWALLMIRMSQWIQSSGHLITVAKVHSLIVATVYCGMRLRSFLEVRARKGAFNKSGCGQTAWVPWKR